MAERISFPFDIAEPRLFHLPSGSAESFGTHVAHIHEVEWASGIPSAPLCMNSICGSVPGIRRSGAFFYERSILMSTAKPY
jgi:hypothetical protein